MIASLKHGAEILLVDDNPADIELTRDLLVENNQYLRLNAVPDGQTALSFLYRRGKFSDVARPDLIVLDLNMPGVDGRDVLCELKSNRELRKIPVIVFTSSPAKDDVVSTYQLGASCYIRKPGNLPEFRAVVKTMANFWIKFASQPSVRNGGMHD